EKAIDLLGNAVVKWSRAEEDVKKKVNAQKEAFEKQLEERRGDADQLWSEWEDIVRKMHALIEEFKYEEARKLAQEFRDRLEGEKSEAAKDMLKRVKDFLKHEWNTLSQRHTQKFVSGISARRDNSKGDSASERLPKIEKLVDEVEDAESNCDNDKLKQQITGLKNELNKLVKQLENAVKSGEDIAKQLAFSRAVLKLNNALAIVRGHVALGRFKKAEEALAAYETECKEYVAYKKDPIFEPIVKDIQLRRDQSEYEQEGIKALAGARNWTIPVSELLKNNPWPTAFADQIGSGEFIVKFEEVRGGDTLWKLLIYDPAKGFSNPDTMDASEFDTAGKRKALGQAIGHVLLNTDIIDDLDKSISKNGPSALVGLFAWMAELGAGKEAYEVIKYRYNKIKEGDADYVVTREYYAFGLLAMVMHLKAEGNQSGAESFLKEFDRDFGDTRAAKSLK
ncbi:MAG: DUF874 domain-containing protein, partial [Planctomycetota bacterium]